MQAVLKKEAFNLVVSDKISYTREVKFISQFIACDYIAIQQTFLVICILCISQERSVVSSCLIVSAYNHSISLLRCWGHCLHQEFAYIIALYVCTMFCTFEIWFVQVPDTRDSRCKAVYYDKELPSTSVIIIFTNEAWSASSSSYSSSPIMKLTCFEHSTYFA